MKLVNRIYCLLFFVFFSGLANANVMVYPMSITMNDVNPSKNQFKVYSKSDKVQYLKIYVKQVLNPATPEEKEVNVSILSGNGIIASPQKIILPPGGEHTVRLRSLSSPSKELLYRVYVEPVAANSDDAQVTTEDGASVGISLTWGVLVYSKPQDPEVKLGVDIKNKIIENTGNVHVWIKDISVCSGATQSTCKKTMIEKSVFPGLSLQIPKETTGVKSIVVNYQTQDSDLKSQHWDF
ncbi:molecular chaperone [Pseudomonas poae]|uniref:P pilus assembly protein, chaperone PapD n=2 Tax=Pseudomonas TaxID=286 RepID=A0ABY0RFV9_9PSED|nr:molecular chaperone [Pseudomonas poae]SDO00034.1 P pilus assembly protein, chaperone PapD [Pseudomonas poae]